MAQLINLKKQIKSQYNLRLGQRDRVTKEVLIYLLNPII